MPPDLFAFRQPPPIAPPGASPLLGSILLAIELCDRPDQLAQWWDWPPHYDARWLLTDEERTRAIAARIHREKAMQAAR